MIDVATAAMESGSIDGSSTSSRSSPSMRTRGGAPAFRCRSEPSHWSRSVKNRSRSSESTKSAYARPSRKKGTNATPVARGRALSERGRSQFVDRELGRCLAPALWAVLHVTPRSQQARPLGVQEHDERLGDRVELEAEVRPPGGRGVARVEVEPLQDPAEAHARRVKEPGAVAGLEDDGCV